MVSQRDVPINVDVIGNVEAYSTITVKAQVGGELTKVSFHEGDFVKKGDLLFTIDERPFEAQLSQAQANLARDTAALSQAQANLARDIANEKYAQDQATRYRGLFDQGVVSREQTDQMRSSADALSQTVLADKAAIESARAQIVASKAAVETATVQMSYTAIRSPIDGRTGNIAVKQGNVVAANTSDLMTITEVSADLRDVLRARSAVERHQAVHGTRPASGPRRSPGRHQHAGSGRADVHRQLGGRHHRHHQTQGHFSKCGQPPVARRIRARDAGADHASARHGGSESGGADRTGRPVRLRGEAGPNRRDAAGGHRHARGSGIGD